MVANAELENRKEEKKIKIKKGKKMLLKNEIKEDSRMIENSIHVSTSVCSSMFSPHFKLNCPTCSENCRATIITLGALIPFSMLSVLKL